jgi:hypothetical protein
MIDVTKVLTLVEKILDLKDEISTELYKQADLKKREKLKNAIDEAIEKQDKELLENIRRWLFIINAD